ncbi:MAG TPA: type II secretion system protein [Phycisphaerales bacterium]|nr:type II secretion system protein [Phycisphaerales bacterium]
MKKAFTLIEILIVVSILGILSAIVFPEFQAHAQQSREAAAKDNLRILRNAIAVYAAQHNDVPPGYQDSVLISGADGIFIMTGQLKYTTDINGNYSGDSYGPYLSELPENPMNQNKSILILAEGDNFPTATGLYGWIYDSATKDIRMDYPGTDSEGIDYYSY